MINQFIITTSEAMPTHLERTPTNQFITRSPLEDSVGIAASTRFRKFWTAKNVTLNSYRLSNITVYSFRTYCRHFSALPILREPFEKKCATRPVSLIKEEGLFAPYIWSFPTSLTQKRRFSVTYIIGRNKPIFLGHVLKVCASMFTHT